MKARSDVRRCALIAFVLLLGGLSVPAQAQRLSARWERMADSLLRVGTLDSLVRTRQAEAAFGEVARQAWRPPPSYGSDLVTLDAHWVDRFDRLSALLGWPVLRTDSLHDGEEIRLWWLSWTEIGLRLVRHGTEVRGQLFIPEIPRPIRDTTGQTRFVHRPAFMADEAARCERFALTDALDVCLRVHATPPDWRAIWRSLDSLGVWMLPNQPERSGLDPSTITTGGSMIAVELRKHRLYRYYTLDWFPRDAYAAALQQIQDLLLDLRDNVPETKATFRVGGTLYPGREPYFVPCYSDEAWRIVGGGVLWQDLPEGPWTAQLTVMPEPSSAPGSGRSRTVDVESVQLLARGQWERCPVPR